MQLRHRSVGSASPTRVPSTRSSGRTAASPTRARSPTRTASSGRSSKGTSNVASEPVTSPAPRARSPSSRATASSPAAEGAAAQSPKARSPPARTRSTSPNRTSPAHQSRESSQAHQHHSSHTANVSLIARFWTLFSFFKNSTVRKIGKYVLTIGPPIAIYILYQIAHDYNGFAGKWWENFTLQSFADHIPRPTVDAALGILAFCVFQWILLVIVPGKQYLAPVTPMGNSPAYKINGVTCYLLTHAAYLIATQHFKLFNGGWCYDHFGAIISTLNISALLLCFVFYFRGLYSPSSSDSGSFQDGFITDFYAGTELHPTIFGHSLKQYVNCRLSMNAWSVMCISFALKSYETTGTFQAGIWVSALLQWIYLLKFFIWESGYFGSMDIQHDRFGFYIGWGVIVWVPAVYTYSTYNMVGQVAQMSDNLAIAVFVLGVISIYINWQADDQRQRCRESRGDCLIWGRKPEVILAFTTLETGEKRSSVLLCSGWWGVSRHFHYVPEILACVFWTSPALCTRYIPWFYPIYLFILLMDRAYRDEERCASKYKESWADLCRRVPYRVVPYIY